MVNIKKGEVIHVNGGDCIICVAVDGNVAVFAKYDEDEDFPTINFTYTYVYDIERMEYGPISVMTDFSNTGNFSLLGEKE